MFGRIYCHLTFLTLAHLEFIHQIFGFCFQEHADYAVQGVDNLQKFKEQVIQNYLGTPTEILGFHKKPTLWGSDTSPTSTCLQKTKTPGFNT